jgi:hypothetical protein
MNRLLQVEFLALVSSFGLRVAGYGFFDLGFRISDFGFKRPHGQDSGCALRARVTRYELCYGFRVKEHSAITDNQKIKSITFLSSIRNLKSEIEKIPNPFN